MEDQEILDNVAEKLKRRRKITLTINIILGIMIILVVTAILLNQFVITRMLVAGTSMDPTLYNGEKVWVNYTKNVKRGDIVVVKHNNKYVVKRIIGTPCDKIKINESGKVFVNNEELREDYISENEIYVVNVWDITLKEDEFFILGDNRGESYDSEDYGPILKKDIVGKVLL